ncbi:MAG TPA: polysaccharide biosynthesis/export family protein [Trinickia sp.]|uniref:polysaccharide biosynthesis/export family protein n=1 Tax=Trinickia sp. TaxID=2571163 RepID=UPI002BB94853|nr:polysaccharide biosynthesis/export family protein [Trinickia sp.]HTI18816.1 polysaccharide biosynthesis/export family protein [Trinickia sp.]
MCFSEPRIRAYLTMFWIALASLVSACSIVPGQRMITPPTVAEKGGEYSTEPKEELQVPITDINLQLIRQMDGHANGAPLSPELLSLIAKPHPYLVKPGDVLQITVWDHPELAAALGQPQQTTRDSDAVPGFLIDEKGEIQFPYAGTVHVAGETVDEVQRNIFSRISKVYRNPQVTVRVASFRASQIYMDGEIGRPGSVQINDIAMTLTQAIGRAGGFTANANQSRVTLVRAGVTYAIDFNDLVRAGHTPNEIILEPDDILHVGARDEAGIYLMGEVNKPATIMPMRNGKLTLAEAISQAGSFDPNTANAKQLFVIRDLTGAKPEIFHLDATSPVSMVLANQFQLRAKDVVYVDNGALVKFNRVLNLFLPAINAGLTAAILTK